MKNKRYTVKEYAKLYNTNRMRVYRMVKSKKLQSEPNKEGVIMIPDNKWNRCIMKL